MADIRTTISLLCKHLNLLLDVNIKPEMFRLAKYNKSDDNVVETFWRLLNIIIIPEQIISVNIVENVKHYFLHRLKYESAHLYALPDDMSYGSRELLVAVGYLLSHDYLNKFIEDAINKSPFSPNATLDTDDAQCYGENYTFNLKQLKTDDDFTNAIEWVEGQVKCNQKIALNYHDHFQKLSKQICERSLLDSNKDTLTLLEVLALNNADKAKAFLEKTEKVSQIVQNHELWLKKQSIFWDWMNSVLREKKINMRLTHLEELEKFADNLKK